MLYNKSCSSCGTNLIQTTCTGIRRILTFTYPATWNEFKLLKLRNNNNENITTSILYAWSTDRICWTTWTTYTQYKKICSHLDSDYFLRILFSGNLSSITIGITTPEYTLCLDNTNIFLTDFCSLDNNYNIYDGLDCAILLQQQLADSIICMFGIPIYYIKVNPNEKTKDFTFKEYVLHTAQSIKKIKLMLENGSLPSSNPQLTTLEFDWSNDWKTELSKTQFATAFGDTAIPQKRDLIYVPLLKRMYEVNAAYDERNENLMWRSITWTLTLVKYTEKTNVDTEVFNDIIDSWVINTYKDTMGCPEMNEQERESGEKLLKAPETAYTNLYNIEISDMIRKSYTKDYIKINNQIVCHRNNIISRNFYKMLSENSKIIYQKNACGNQGTIILNIETPGNIELNDNIYSLVTVGEVTINLLISDGKLTIISDKNISTELEFFSKYIIALVWNIPNGISELHIWPYTHEDMPLWRLKPEMWWFDFENPYSEVNSIINIDWDMSMSTKYNSQVSLMGYPLACIYNFKYYTRALNNEDLIKECIKYTTDHPACVICDAVRPFYDEGHGYAIK